MPVAIVTGASRGIGRAIALQLADDGLDVVVNDIQPQLADLEAVRDEIRLKGRKTLSVLADVSQEIEVKNLVETTVKELGELNIMVANAGIIVPKTMFEVSLEEFNKVQSVNVSGVFLCYREAGRQMIAQGKGGKIIGACSTAAYGSSGNTFAYSVSKWAVRGMTQGVAMELGSHKINVNAYCPGPVDTDMWEKIDASIGKRTGLAKGAAFAQSVEKRAAMKRASKPEDIANLVSFLASSKADNITGQSMLCDGGINFS